MTSRIDLFGWDTVFAASYAQVNNAIVQAKSTPPSFNYTASDTGLTISGSWGDWQLTAGGDGQNLQMHCLVVQGQATDGTTPVDLSNGWVQIQIRLDRLPDPSANVSDTTGTGGDAQKLVVNLNSTADNPAVSIINSSFPSVKGIWKYALPQLFDNWFNANINTFNHVFAIVLLNVKAEQGDYQWLKPVTLSYACADALDSSLDKSVFATLCLTDNQSAQNNGTLSHQIDARILDNLPADANTAFAISAERALKKIFLPGAFYSLQGSQPADFDISNDNIWITNNKDLTWGNFQLDSGQQVQPVIQKGNFQLGLQDQYLVVQVTDANFNWPDWKGPGNITIHMNYTQQFEFELQKVSKGWVFVPKPGIGTKNITTSIVSDQAVLIFDIVIGIATSIVGAVVGSVIGGAIGSALKVSEQTATEATVIATEEAINSAVENAPQDALKAVDEEAADAASSAIKAADNPTFLQKFSSSLAANKWKILGGMVGGILAVPAGFSGDITKLIASGDLEDIPTFDTFAATCVGTTTWPFTTGWEPRGTGLQGPLVIQGKLTD